MEKRLPKGTLGGQAVMEGVMMKGPDSYSVAVRRPDQKIEVKLIKYKAMGDKHKVYKIPFVRGIVNFVESLTVGMKTLTYSSSFYEEDEGESKADKLIKDIFKEKAESVIIGFTVLLSIVIAVALFMMLPAAMAELVGKWVKSRALLSVIEGLIRLVIFLLYVVLISQMEDIKRVFMYHGAEHKTINCYEAGRELTTDNIARYSRYHKRCGTSFLFLVMIISIFVFMFITAEQMWLRFLLRLVLIPVVAGASYECIRMAGRNNNLFFDILSRPGMWIQKLTTKEPTEEMMQVAILAVESVLYGQDYVNAVNQAQGIGVEEPEDHDSEENMDDVDRDISSENEVYVEEWEEDGLSFDEDVEMNIRRQDESDEEYDISDFENSFFEE